VLAAVVVDDVPEAGGVAAVAAKVDVGSTQLSGTLVHVVPLVGVLAVANTPCARLSEPNDVEM